MIRVGLGRCGVWRRAWLLIGAAVLAVAAAPAPAPAVASSAGSGAPQCADSGWRAACGGMDQHPTGGLDAAAAVARTDWLGPPGRAEPRDWNRRKNPTLAMVCSFLVPGLGQLYNERELWTLVAAGVHFYFIGNIVAEARLTNRYRTEKNLPDAPPEAEVLFLLHRDNRIQSTWLLGLTLLLSGIQSFVDAHLFDFDAEASLQFEPAWGSVNGAALRLHF